MLEENTQPEVVEEEQDQVTQEVDQQDDGPMTEEEKQYFKVKHLHEEKEIPYDEAPTYIQKGLDYDRVKSKYEASKGTLDFVENLARREGMGVDEYIQAVNEYNERQQVEEIASKHGMPPELAEELYLLRKERKEKQAMQAEVEAKEKKQQDYMKFFQEFPDVKPEDIPTEVFDMINKNPSMSLVDAYIRHDYNTLKGKLNTEKVNAKNSQATTGSVTGDTTNKSNYISKEVFEKNRTDKEWVRKNFEALNKSRAKWE